MLATVLLIPAVGVFHRFAQSIWHIQFRPNAGSERLDREVLLRKDTTRWLDCHRLARGNCIKIRLFPAEGIDPKERSVVGQPHLGKCFGQSDRSGVRYRVRLQASDLIQN